jgi:hypothetical protein
MKTIINKLGEKQTSWTSHKHPENSNFMQVVRFMHIQTSDGKNNLYWRLSNSAPNDKHIIGNINLSEALSKFTDVEVLEVTEADYQEWLKNRK